jgi:hypothetical protein
MQPWQEQHTFTQQASDDMQTTCLFSRYYRSGDTIIEMMVRSGNRDVPGNASTAMPTIDLSCCNVIQLQAPADD